MPDDLGMIRHLHTRLVRLLTRPRRQAPADPWTLDPLSHPAIRRMTERERADLPFDPPQVATPGE